MSTSASLVIVVILNWNKAEQTATCIAALRRQTHPNLRIIVVDNGSESSLAPLLKLTSPFTLIRNDQNCGFTGGVNIGIRKAIADGADYIWLLNNDAEPADETLQTLLSVMEANVQVGLASPLIRNGDAGDEIEFCGGLWQENSFRTTADPATYRKWSEAWPERIWLVGTALLVRRQLVEKIGLFDDRFFAYWEDNDYSVRSIRAGYRNVVVPGTVVHHWSGTPKTDPGSKPAHYYYYMARNEILFLRKHIALHARVKFLWWAIERQIRLVDRLADWPMATHAIFLGIWDGLLGRGSAYDPQKRLSPIVERIMAAAVRMKQGHGLRP